MQTIVDGIKTQYFEEGSNQKVALLLHGWWRESGDFADISGFLSHEYRVVRLDLPGFGGSDRPKETWSVADYVNFVKKFQEKISVSPQVLLGHSFGGRIILKGVGSGVLDAEKLVLISAAGLKTAGMRKFIFMTLAKIGDLVFSLPFLSLIKDRLKRRFYKLLGSGYINSGHMKDIFKVVVDEDLSQFAKKIDTPTLLIWGKDDLETPVEQGLRLHKLLKNSELVELDGTGHFSFIEKADKVKDIIVNFIRRP